MSHSASTFDELFAGDDDPWKFRDRWYESRKRALTLACLPAPRYRCAFEPGCANGELSAALATRCDRLLVSDGAARAVEIARRRTAGLPQVEVRQAWLPAQWPSERFDLIVVSELGYYLDAESLTAFGARLLESLEPGGTVLACHWRRRIDGCQFDGDEVQQHLAEVLGLPPLLQVMDADLRLDVWCRDAASVAEREGLVG